MQIEDAESLTVATIEDTLWSASDSDSSCQEPLLLQTTGYLIHGN